MIDQRLRSIIDNLNISQTGFAQQIGITVQRLNGYLTGRNRPGNDILVKMADALEVSVDFLLGLTDNARPYMDFSENDFSTLFYTDRPEEMVRHKVPLYESRSYDSSLPGIERYGTFIIEGGQAGVTGELYALFIKEDSMFGEFLENDVVFIKKPGQTRENGKIYALKTQLKDTVGVCLRKCVFQEDKIIAIPVNPAYLPVLLEPAKLGYDPVTGRVAIVYRESLLQRT